MLLSSSLLLLVVVVFAVRLSLRALTFLDMTLEEPLQGDVEE